MPNAECRMPSTCSHYCSRSALYVYVASEKTSMESGFPRSKYRYMTTFDKVLLGFANIVPLDDSIYVRVLLLFECINVINTRA